MKNICTFKNNNTMKKIKLYAIAILFANFIFSQELDESFLNSLPDDIKKDVLDRSATQTINTEQNYKSYQYSSKLQQDEDLLNLKKRLELDLLELEKRLINDNEQNLDKELKLFGADFFNTFQTSFMPINEPNLDSGYSLDVGDILNIQLIGQKDYIKNFQVNSDGSVKIPDIGKLIVAGLSLSEASNLIKSKVNSVFIGTEAFVSLDKIRDVNILVTGNSKFPGIYTLTGNSNILHALSAAGGISEYGSYRDISLIRAGKTIEKLDVYDLLIGGNFNLDKRLRSGDVIFVNPIKNIVSIDGAVKRPGMYEVTNEENLYDVIKYANGFKQTADIQNISLERILDGSLKSIPIFNENQFKSISAIDGDLIYIREFSYRRAKISGSVKKPGFYTMANGETLSDLIDKAGGINKNADLFAAVYLNQSAKEIDEIAKDILYKDFIDNIIYASQKNVGSNTDLAPIISLIAELKDSRSNGRIVVDLLDESSKNLFLIKDGDELIIPETVNNIYVYGEISTEGSIMYEPDRGVEFYINKSGGYKKYADTKSMYILHPNGESQKINLKRNIFESKPKDDIQIYPGSVIFVPKIIDDTTSRTLAAQAYVSILGSLGIALASLSSINNN